MKNHKRHQNIDCGVLFTPCPQVPGQVYCSRKACQQIRKKFATDPDYREYKQAAQEKRKAPPQSLEAISCSSPAYTQKNRARNKGSEIKNG